MSVSCEKVSDRTNEEAKFLERMRNQPCSPHPSEVDNVNHPPHYNNNPAKCECGRRIECIDVTRHFPFNIGNAIKYLWRCELKSNSLEDLKKAAWYIQDEISKREKSR
jgi:hypothetical protein